MYVVNCNRSEEAFTHHHRNWNIEELEARAGALVSEALQSWPDWVKATHWEDMKHTAMLSFLGHQDKPTAYVYTMARNDLKNYKWVHIRGLNGGWKSLEARNYMVADRPLEDEPDEPGSSSDRVYWKLLKEHTWEIVPRPVEWRVIGHLDDHNADNAALVEQVFRDILYILAGMSQKNWYPEQIYRGALIIALLITNHTWEDVERQTQMDYSEIWDIWWYYRRSRIGPYLTLTPLHREIIMILGQTRLVYFEELSSAWLNEPKRKMVVLPTGIYTIIYKKRSGKPSEAAGGLQAMLQKCRSVDNRPVIRAVSLGPVGAITKEDLLEATKRLEQKWASPEASV
jgi:hypothetical protein